MYSREIGGKNTQTMFGNFHSMEKNLYWAENWVHWKKEKKKRIVVDNLESCFWFLFFSLKIIKLKLITVAMDRASRVKTEWWAAILCNWVIPVW